MQSPLIAHEKMLVHLVPFRYIGPEDIHPAAMTQEGISDAVDISRPYITKELMRLSDLGLVSSMSARVAGMKRRRRIYFLTDKGREEAKRVAALFEGFLLDETVDSVNGRFGSPRFGGEIAGKALLGNGPRPYSQFH